MLTVFFFLVFAVAVCIGSFLNVVIHRLPRMHYRAPGDQPYNLNTPSSHCPVCQHTIKWYENIPLLSWLALRGRCSACNTYIPWRYPLLELLAGIGSVLIVYYMGFTFIALMCVPVWLMSIPVAWWLYDKNTNWTGRMRQFACFFLIYSSIALTALWKL